MLICIFVTSPRFMGLAIANAELGHPFPSYMKRSVFNLRNFNL